MKVVVALWVSVLATWTYPAIACVNADAWDLTDPVGPISTYALAMLLLVAGSALCLAALAATSTLLDSEDQS